MKKALKLILFFGLATGLLLMAALPVVLPPFVTRIAEEKLAAFGFPSSVQLDLTYIWDEGPELAGSLRLNLLHSPVEIRANIGVGFGTWHAHLRVPAVELTESDPTVLRLLKDHPLPKGVSNLTFNATLALEATAERTWRTPVPVWSARLPIREVSASLVRDERPIAVSALSITPGASGIADHVDIAPMFLRTSAVTTGGFTLTNLTAAIHATDRTLLVTEAKAGVCGGQISLYSLFLDPKTLNAGLTLFLNDVEAGDILGHFRGFHGQASGRLHGKLRLFLKEGGKTLRLGDAFLYSTPGESGKLKMTDTDVVTDNLALAGIDATARQNVANALADLDYSVLKLDLKRTSGDAATLGIRLSGTATRKDLTVPVDLNINFNGKLEQILNTGLGLSNRLKGNK